MAKRVHIFVDLGNMYYRVFKRFGQRKIDFQKYLAFCQTHLEDAQVVQSRAYGTQRESEATPFIQRLQFMGWHPIYNVIGSYKGHSWVPGMTVDVMKIAANTDIVIIGSSDAGFLPVIEHLQNEGIQVLVIGAIVNPHMAKTVECYEISEEELEDESTDDASG